MTTNRISTKKLTTLAMLSAIAYALVFVSHNLAIPLVPAVSFLSYDPKDIIIVIGGFMFGPMACLVVSLVVSLLEMVTISDTGLYGMVMNVISTCAFACTAALIYKKRRTMAGAVVGIVAGCLLMAGVMLLWNYIITPLHMGLPRAAVAGMLLPAFLPFNLLKGGINSAVTLLLYKPVVMGLRRVGLLDTPQTQKGKPMVGVWLCAAMVLATCILLVLAFQGII